MTGIPTDVYEQRAPIGATVAEVIVAPPLVVPSGAALSLFYSVLGQLAMNRLGVLITAAPVFDQALADRIGASLKAAWTTLIAPNCPPSTEFLRVGIRDLRTANQTEFRDQGAPVAGVGLLDPLPKQDTLCLTTRTSLSGKSARGRIYAVGFDESANGPDGLATAAIRTAMITFYTTSVFNALSADGMRLGVMTRPQEDIVINEVTTHADGSTTIRRISHQTAKPGRVLQVVNVESRDAEWETQRRRANGRGSAAISALTGGMRMAMP